jgi:uncharacterized phage-like protein YoqJ
MLLERWVNMVDAVITGHRTGKLGNKIDLQSKLRETFVGFKVKRIIQGMADGTDLIAAKAAFKSDIPFIGVRPGLWHTPSKDWASDYASALKLAEAIKVVDTESQKYPGPWAYFKRNEYMVNMIHAMHQDIIIAVWDGSQSGTSHCVNYALSKNLRVWNIDPNTLEGGWLK